MVVVISICVLAATLFSLAFWRTAWVSEDAFITFRVVDNVLGGHGPVWNPGERVQVYTHPLWFGLLLALVPVVGDPYHTVLLLSYVLLLVALGLAGLTVQEWTWPALVAPTALLWSRSFIDYASSGLENPLTHALLAAFLLAWFRWNHPGRSLVLSLLTSALFLTRPDAVLLVAPALAVQFWRERRWIPMAVGMLPAVLWVLFSLFYYGAPVPNTALAKVGTGQSAMLNAAQAWAYLRWTTETDVVTLVLLVSGFLAGLADRKSRAFAVALVLWVAYLFHVGADYMGGRFFSGPVFLAACLLAAYASRVVAAALAVCLALSTPVLGTTVFSPADFDRQTISDAGIADERGFYYRTNGLVPYLQRGAQPSHPWLFEGQVLRDHPGWYTRCAIGMIAYAAGPAVRWVDPLALAEPFLARLPSRSQVRVGHYERAFPAGYLDSILTGQNRLSAPALRFLYGDVQLAVYAPLWSWERVGAIWRLNSGAHATAGDAFDREAVGLPGVPVQTRSPMSCYGVPYGWDGTWRLAGPPARAMAVRIR